MWKLHPLPPPPHPEKSHPLLSQQPPQKSLGPVKPPFFENLVVGSTPPPPLQKGEGDVHTMNWLGPSGPDFHLKHKIGDLQTT